MLIALDYDGTYTLDPPFWDQFIASRPAKSVIIVTMRYPKEANATLNELAASGVSVFCTGRKAKRKFLYDLYRIVPDIWIDDKPEYVVEDSI